MEFCELLGNSNNSAPPALAADLQLVEEGFKGAAGGIRPFTHHPLSFTFLTTSIGGGGVCVGEVVLDPEGCGKDCRRDCAQLLRLSHGHTVTSFRHLSLLHLCSTNEGQ